MKISEYRLGFVGFGHMAQVICRAIENSKLIPRSQMLFVRRTPSKIKESEKEFGITSTSLENLVEKSDLLLVAVRPHQADGVLKELASCGASDKLIVSVMAGIQLAHYQKYFGSAAQIARALPNTASAVGEGMTVFSYSPKASSEFRSLNHLLFSCMGEVQEIPENLMDICCGISGSGPGFVFRLIQAVAKLGEKEGLPYEQALKLTAQTFAGAARLILKGAKPETLIDQIATPNGTTEAGYRKMNENQIDRHLQDVILACAQRSKEISQQFLKN